MDPLLLGLGALGVALVADKASSDGGSPPSSGSGGAVQHGSTAPNVMSQGGTLSRSSSRPANVPTNLGSLLTDALAAGLNAQDVSAYAHPTISSYAGAFAAIGAGIILAVGITSPYALPIAIAIDALFNVAGAIESDVREAEQMSWLKKFAQVYKRDVYGNVTNPREVFEYYLAGLKSDASNHGGGWVGPTGNDGGFSTTLPQDAQGNFVDDDSDAADWQKYLGLDAPSSFTANDGKMYSTRGVIKSAVLWALAQPNQQAALDQVHQLTDQLEELYPWVAGVHGLGPVRAGALRWTPRRKLTVAEARAQYQQQRAQAAASGAAAEQTAAKSEAKQANADRKTNTH